MPDSPLRLPMFPLNTVLFPGVSVPLLVFEERYRAMVEHLLQAPEPADRVFVTVAIREGYEVGDHGAQSLYRIGVRMQLGDVEQQPDGSFEVVVVGIDRIRLDRLDASGPYPVGEVTLWSEPPAAVPEELLDRARATFTAYRAALVGLRSDPFSGTLPRDPEYLSWTLAACAPLPLHERQSLLEADDAEERIALVNEMLRAELRAMNVVPSLPATEVARTKWSPN